MPAAASPTLVSTKAARFSILSIQLACGDLLSAGVLIEDPQSDRLYVRLRRDWERIAGEEAEVLSELEHGMRSDAEELGAARVLEQMEQITTREFLYCSTMISRLFIPWMNISVGPLPDS